ncbi:hypothetical protein V6Z12_D01G255400 [Gossypium hirsutum]
MVEMIMRKYGSLYLLQGGELLFTVIKKGDEKMRGDDRKRKDRRRGRACL